VARRQPQVGNEDDYLVFKVDRSRDVRFRRRRADEQISIWGLKDEVDICSARVTELEEWKKTFVAEAAQPSPMEEKVWWGVAGE
jgi:hypothetical protein